MNSVICCNWVMIMKYLDRICALREDKDLTQTDIANLLNIGQKTHSDYELGKTRIPLDSMLVLAKYSGIINYLYFVREAFYERKCLSFW